MFSYIWFLKLTSIVMETDSIHVLACLFLQTPVIFKILILSHPTFHTILFSHYFQKNVSTAVLYHSLEKNIINEQYYISYLWFE